jgi:Rrf2 family protein
VTQEAKMQITRQADYAVRAVLYLAQLEPGQRAATAQVSREQRIPQTFLAKIVAQLASAGVLRTTRGAHGGIWLARAAETLSLLEVVEVIDGPLALNACVQNPEVCELAGSCAVRAVWCEAQADLVQRLAQTNFGQLAHQAQLVPQPAAALVP